jgi:hypothetical protein
MEKLLMPNTNTNTTSTTIVCDGCTNDVPTSDIADAVHENYGYVCRDCHSDHFRYSDRREIYVHNDDWDYEVHEYEEEEEHNDDDDQPENSEYIYAYSSGSFKREIPLCKPYENFTKETLTLGVELEVQVKRSSHLSRHDLAFNITQHDLKDFAIIKNDSSIGYGFEIVSKPATFEYHKTAWDIFFTNTAQYLRSFKDTSTGLHVHVNQSAFSKSHVGRMFIFINSDVNKTFIDDISGRTETEYCHKKKDPKFKDVRTYRSRGAFNIFCDHTKTHEFRCFSGNVKKESFFKTLEFVVALCHYSQTECGNVNINYIDFCNYVKSKHFEYPYLFNWLIDRSYLKNLNRLKQKTKFYTKKRKN